MIEQVGTTFARWYVVHKPRLAAPAMHRKSGRQISQAIDTCLDLFYLTARPQAAIARTLGMLRQLGWREGDLVRVERVARKAFGLPPCTPPLQRAA